MKKFMKMFKSLPPEARSALAMVGLASPVCVIYFVKRSFFPRVPLWKIILIALIVVAVIALLVYVISWIFKRGSKSRAKRMEGELADDATAGPQSMDKSADAKSNNAKFFKAIRDMKKDVGIDVYALPWYITIGDSGCGKTKLINEGGLTFSRGKPEGYQLGTLNYNWWFTEEAIIIDMAGRLCNPRDDSDRREWEGLLGTIGKGRKGFPINGALVCVAADHLLQDPPEKIERDANTVLERLRDLQSRLGVTFATYLMITKCDKILGFMQFFDRADRDIRVKNQMFGWSRPGSFDQPYSPDNFEGAFDDVYARLNELRLRRLNDDSEETDLGLAHSFPEEFRGLYDPLQIYVSTLFPLIRQAKAVKNLIFRGVYFTSATQEGALILKHLTDRLGQESADQFPPLDDLYPNKRPHFIKDLLLQKVIPEQGLVFRNEQQVVRNRKLNKMLTVATGVLFVVLGALLWWSSSKFDTLVGVPAENARNVADGFAGTTAEGALGQAAKIEESIEKLNENPWAARMLSGPIHSANEPVVHLQTLRLVLIERAMKDALQSVGKALSRGRGLPGDSPDDAETYLNALNEYVTWDGCRGEVKLPQDHVTAASFKAMRTLAGPEGVITHKRFDDQIESYFLVNLGPEHRRNPSGVLQRYEDLDSQETVQGGLARLGAYLTKLATLSADHPKPIIRAWMRIRDGCDGAKSSYETLLELTDRANRVTSVDDFRELQTDFATSAGVFDESLTACSTWDGQKVGDAQNKIPTLEQAILAQRDEWREHLDELEASAEACGPANQEVRAFIESLRGNTGSGSLDRVYWNSLRNAGVVEKSKMYQPGVFEPETFGKYVREVHTNYKEIVSLEHQGDDAGDQSDRLSLTKDAGQARARIASIGKPLAGANVEAAKDLTRETPDTWLERFGEIFPDEDDDADGEEPNKEALAFDYAAFWKDGRLTELGERVGEAVRRANGTQLLAGMNQRLVQINDEEDWGYAALIAGYDERDPEFDGPYSIRVASSSRRRSTNPSAAPSVPSRRRGRRIPSRGSRDRGPGIARPTQPGVRTTGSGTIEACATHSFLNEQAETLVALTYYLSLMGGEFLEDAKQGEVRLDEDCRKALERTARKYMDRYVAKWNEAYHDDPKLERLERLRQGARDWPQLATRLRSSSDRKKIRREFEPALRMILQAVPWATFDVTLGFWDGPGSEHPWPIITEWMSDAIEDHRNDLGDFAFHARENLENTGEAGKPWAAIARDFGDALEDLLTAISQNGNLDRPDPNAKTIDWKDLGNLRDQFQYTDERLTGELIQFVGTAQQLFGEHLTDRLAKLQDALGTARPQDGWPYLPGEGLETVDFEVFKEFLTKVQETAGAYRNLDVPDTPGYSARAKFFASCEQWHAFLWPDGHDSGMPTKLTATVTPSNPNDRRNAQKNLKGERPDIGCQMGAALWVLDLGFAGQARGIETACVSDRMRDIEIEWDWRPQGERLLTYSLRELTAAENPDKTSLGKHSPLALCAFLQGRCMSTDGSTWDALQTMPKVRHRQRDGRMLVKDIGQVLTFRLERKLPGPIVKLERLPRPGRDGS